MQIAFHKYQGAGNDFILIDNLNHQLNKIPSATTIAQWCDRHFGIGADGCIFLEASPTADFYMRYFNSDGSTSTLCGNGARCAVAFAHQLGHIKATTTFEASDGMHSAEVITDEQVRLKMNNVTDVLKTDTYCFIDTGAPHHLIFLENAAAVEATDVVTTGRKIRNGAPYFEEGSNVNFIAPVSASHFLIRTYERGVEDETLACGTGAVAAALGAHTLQKTTATSIQLQTRGGHLKVEFKVSNNQYSDIQLTGPATFVFKGFLNAVGI
jgi:diaminopimelate epimerase